MKMFGTVFFICTCFFVLFVVLAGSPVQRINRACMPVGWMGTAITTVGAIFSARTESQVREGSNTAFNTCRFFVFRQFYAEEWKRQREAAGQSDSQEQSKESQP